MHKAAALQPITHHQQFKITQAKSVLVFNPAQPCPLRAQPVLTSKPSLPPPDVAPAPPNQATPSPSPCAQPSNTVAQSLCPTKQRRRSPCAPPVPLAPSHCHALSPEREKKMKQTRKMQSGKEEQIEKKNETEDKAGRRKNGKKQTTG
ncbi:hypothetical protein M0R45_025753 [Rubus argutus]|uniref:Uncharacterized protein n=1 Tax=Rubus argutus TaxID=59490 RepID=A0AAW1WV39_RUBAR